MTQQFDFYILNTPSLADSLPFCARLLAKVYRAGLAVQVDCEQDSILTALDTLLWDNPIHPFLPHTLTTAPATLHVRGRDQAAATVWMPLQPASTPVDHCPWQRVLQIVPSHPDWLAPARAQFRALRDAGLTVNTHNIGKG